MKQSDVKRKGQKSGRQANKRAARLREKKRDDVEYGNHGVCDAPIPRRIPPKKQGEEKQIENLVSRHVDRVVEQPADTRARRKHEQVGIEFLQNSHNGHDAGKPDLVIQQPFPMRPSLQGADGHRKPRKEMQQRKQSIHALLITPPGTKRVDREHDGKRERDKIRKNRKI